MNRTILIIVGLACAVISAAGIMLTTSRPLYSTKKGYTKAFIAQIEMALEIYKEKNGMFPTTEQGLSALLEKPTIPPIPGNWHNPYCTRVTDAWGKPIQYRYPSVHPPNLFDLWSFGPDKIESADDINNWTDDRLHDTATLFYSVLIIIGIIAGLIIIRRKYPPDQSQPTVA